MSRTGLIYKITAPSGKVYIGQTICGLKRRKQLHEFNAVKGAKTRIAAAIRKYKDELVWEIIHDNVPLEELDELETNEICRHDSFKHGYNAIPNSFGGGFIGKQHTEETKKLLSEQKSGTHNPMFGKTGELNPFYGKKHSEETKATWSRADMSGDKNPMYGKSGAMLGKQMTDSAKKILSEKQTGSSNSFYGKKHSEETKRKMREGHLRRKRNE